MSRSGPLRTFLVAIVTVLAASVGTGAAHEDLRIVDATIELGPGEGTSFPTAIHYHRVVGRYAVLDGPSDVSLTLVSTATDGRSDGFEVVLADGLAAAGTVNRLIRCCDARDWTEARLDVRNHGDRATTIQLRAWAMHDDFAVVVDRAEPGAAAIPLALFLALGFVATGVEWRDGRRIDPATDPGRTPPSLRWSAGLALATLTLAAGLGAGGMVRYGAGPVDGTIAILADLPLPGGLFGARGGLVMAVLMLTWTFAIGLWIRSLHVGAHRRSAGPVRLGLALGVVSLAVGVVMGWTYGSYGVPVLLGLALGAPLVVVAWALGRPGRAADHPVPR